MQSKLNFIFAFNAWTAVEKALILEQVYAMKRALAEEVLAEPAGG